MNTLLFLFISLFSTASLFSMDIDNTLRRIRGNSKTVQMQLKQILDTPVESPTDSPKEPRTPEINLGYCDFEDNLLSDDEQEQSIVFKNIETYTSPADKAQNWRTEERSRPGNPIHWYKKRTSVPSHQKAIRPQPIKPQQKNSSQSGTENQQLMVIAHAASIHNRSSTHEVVLSNSFSLLSEETT